MASTDLRVSSSILVDDIQLNCKPAGGAFVFDRDDTYAGQLIHLDLVEDDVVTL